MLREIQTGKEGGERERETETHTQRERERERGERGRETGT
jgi:hypothetical protein